MEKRRLTADERYQMMSLGVAGQILANAVKRAEKRVRMVPGGWRDLKLVEAKLKTLLEKIMDTMPTEQIRAYAHSLHDADFTVGVRCRAVNNEALRESEHAMYVSLSSLSALGDAAQEKCMMCGLDKAGQAKCPLRKALDELPNNAGERFDGGCPYYGI